MEPIMDTLIETVVSFNDLPAELKLFIFSYFNPAELNKKVSKVCKNWRHLCCDPFNWRRLFIVGHEITSEQKVAVLNRNPFIHYIRFFKIHDFKWFSNADKNTSVRSIKLDRCSFSKLTMLRLTDVFPNVESVKILWCQFELDALLQITRWKLLKSFRLEGSKPRNFWNYLPLFAERVNRFEELNLGVHTLSRTGDFNRVIELQGKHLKFLRTYDFMFVNQTYQLIATTCVNLTELQLYTSRAKDQDLLELSKLTTLKNLHLCCSVLLFSENFPSLFKDAEFANLNYLVVFGCHRFDDACLKTILKCCPKLTDLNLRYVKKISNNALKNIPSVCRNLELLVLEQFEQLTKKCVEEIVSQLPNMCYCVTCYCPLINGDGLWRVVDMPKSRMFARRNSFHWEKDYQQ